MTQRTSPLRNNQRCNESWSSKIRKRGEKANLNLVFFCCLTVSVVMFIIEGSFVTDSTRRFERENPVARLNSKQRGLVEIQTSTSRSSGMDNTDVSATEVQRDEDESNVEYYMVFSTACSAFQDWQSYVFFYSAMKVKQPGHVIRIASGCSEEKTETLKKTHEERVRPMSNKFHLHFTPDFSGEFTEDYKYNNKPFGLRHFLENFLEYPEKKDVRDAIVIVVDPDQLLLKPITRDFSNATVIWHAGLDRGSGEKLPATRVQRGTPLAQLYAFGPEPFQDVNVTYVVGEDSPALKVSTEDAGLYYAAGPPYLATVEDMYNIAVKWTEFMPRVYEDYPDLLAEMFGYSLSAAHLGLPHQLAESFMVSNPDTKEEGWALMDSVPVSKICEPNVLPTESLPHVFHYCQNYWLGKWFIGKYRLDSNFISCKAPLLLDPPKDVGLHYDYYIAPGGLPYGKKEPLSPGAVKRNAWGLCRLIAELNEVAVYFKTRHCDGTANFNKTYVFGPGRAEYNSSLQIVKEATALRLY